jgi:Caspase domain/GDSL-like Lipase/Acylhydrolase family
MSKKNCYALFVGIDDYREEIVINNLAVFPKLGGCVSDVTAVREQLAKDDTLTLHAKTLTDRQATKAAIVEAFEQHLGKAKKSDLVLFHFAGHGTVENADRAIWTTETDGRLEGIVCYYDKGDAGKLILADKEIRYLLQRLWRKTEAHILVMFDCCHSGDNTRSIAAALPGAEKGVKLTPRRSRAGLSFPQRAWSDFIFSKDLKAEQFKGKTIDEVIPPGRYVQFAAAESNEPALEADGHGVFTTALLNALRQTGGYLSYRDLHSRIRNQLRYRFEQRPKLYVPDGAQDLLDQGFLGKAPADAGQGAVMTFNQIGGYLIDRGAVHGVQEGLTTVQVKLAKGTVTGKVKDVELDTARVLFSSADAAKIGANGHPVVLGGLATRQLRIHLKSRDAADKQLDLLTKALGESEAARFVALENEESKADYTLLFWHGLGYLTRPKDYFRPIARPVDLGQDSFTFFLVSQLRHLAQWEYLAALQNSGKTALSASALKVEFFIVEASGQEVMVPLKKGGIELTFDPVTGGGPRDFGRKIKVRVTNRSASDLYVSASFHSYSGSVHGNYLIDPSPVMLEKGESKWLRDHKSGTVSFSLADVPYWYNWEKTNDLIKLTYSTMQFDAAVFNMAALPEPYFPEDNRIAQRTKFGDDDPTEPASLQGWNAQNIAFVVRNPLYNKLQPDDIKAMMEDDRTRHFALGLYFTEGAQKPGQPFGTGTYTLRKDVVAQQRNVLWDATLNVVNSVAGFWRERQYKKMRTEFPDRPRIVSEGDSWFQHPILNDVIDNINQHYPVHCLAAAGDTIENYLKSGKFAAAVDEVQPKAFLLSGGGNDILGESMAGFLNKTYADAPEGTQPERFFNAQYAVALGKLDAQYRTVFEMLQKSHPALHILIHGYDYPRPLEPGSKKMSWVGKYFDAAGIKRPGDRTAAMAYMIDGFNRQLAGLATQFPNKVHYLNLRNTVEAGQWDDEIHPNDEGFQRVGTIFMQKLAEVTS